MKDNPISKFCEESEKILQNNLYGLVLDMSVDNKDVYIFVVPRVKNKEDIKYLKELKKKLEKKHKTKLNAIYMPPDEFSEVISYAAKDTDISTLQETLKVCSSRNDFYQKFLWSVLNPKDTSSVKIDDYTL
jgi:hypothetical protein